MGSSDTKSTQTALAEPREKQTKQQGMHVEKGQQEREGGWSGEMREDEAESTQKRL